MLADTALYFRSLLARDVCHGSLSRSSDDRPRLYVLQGLVLPLGTLDNSLILPTCVCAPSHVAAGVPLTGA